MTLNSCQVTYIKNSLVNGPVLLDTAIEIKFDCFVPHGRIEETATGVFRFSNKIKHKRRKFEFAAVIDFLAIPKDDAVARHDFYMRWGFLDTTNEYAAASENQAGFDFFHNELCNLNKQRLDGNLKNTFEFRMSDPNLIKWAVHTFENVGLALPVYNPPNLMTAIYLSWFFGSKELKGMRTCQRHLDFGPKRGCQVYFIPKPKHKIYCCGNCKKAAHEKLNPRNRRSKK